MAPLSRSEYRLACGLLLMAAAAAAHPAGLDLSLPAAPPEPPPAAAAPSDDALAGDPQRLPPVVVTAPHDAFLDADARLKKLQDSLSCLGCDGKQRDPRPRAVQIGEAVGQTLFGLFSSYRAPTRDEPADRALAGAQAGISTYDNPGGGTRQPNQP